MIDLKGVRETMSCRTSVANCLGSKYHILSQPLDFSVNAKAGGGRGTQTGKPIGGPQPVLKPQPGESFRPWDSYDSNHY